MVIQRVVRDSFGRFRACYEDGLRRNRDLQGKVVVRFVIDLQGAVSLAKDDGGTMPDPAVVQCILQGFGALSFPPPQGGMITVVYPIVFKPESDAAGAGPE